MPCTSPIRAHQPQVGAPLKFYKKTDPQYWVEPYNGLAVPCNQCQDCRIRRLSDWGLRMMHHASTHERNCFLTLTYDDAHLPEHGTLYKPHLQQFFKRLRYYHGGRLSYYACGEYGETTQRAHYHVCLFGHDFDDKVAFRKIGEHQLYLSDQLTKIWGHGNTSVGSLTYESAAYTASYVMKKMLGKGCPRYVRLDTETGELIPLVQPFAVMSLRPAIASAWLHTYHADIYGHDKDTIRRNGKELKPARYYDKIYDTINPAHMSKIKQLRVDNHEPLTVQQLRARASITRARMKQKQRREI